MVVSEILKIVLEFVVLTVITILTDRYLNDAWAFSILFVCLVGLGWLHREWLWELGQSNRVTTVTVSVFVFGIIGLGLGLLFTKPRALSGGKQPDDMAGHIESLLGAVPDSAYRQLVASVIYAFDPNASIAVGNLVGTPDGIRTVDIEIRSSGKDGSPLTAIDVIDLPPGHKADISAVDAADSKRADIKADVMLLCSNTGFESDAISKAKRKNIGLISVLRQGDKRIKAIIEEEIYLRKVDITPVNITWNGDGLGNLNPNPDVLEYNGGSVAAWLTLKASLIAGMNPELTVGITDTFNFIKPTDFYKNGKRITLKSMAVSFTPRIQWLSQIVQLDAKAGIYDYVRGRVLLAGGQNSYTIRGIDFNHATPLPSPPPMNALGVGLKPGEVNMWLADVHGAPTPETVVADLDSLIRPEDLRLRLKKEEIDKLKRPSAP
jgi:hypothetical protein